MNTVHLPSRRPARPLRAIRPARRQRGVILIITMIILVAMTLASVAMIRSVDTSTMIAGNVSFKQSAVNSGDAGLEAGIQWLMNNGASLENNIEASGYYAASQDSADLTGNKTPKNADDDIDWTSGAAKLAKDSAGNEVAYVIHRMCNTAGPLNAGTCSTDLGTQGGSSLGAGRQMKSYQKGKWDSVSNRGYYRITARVTGPKNAASYVQAIISR